VVAPVARGDGFAESEVEGSLQETPAAPRRLRFAAGLLERANDGHETDGEPPDVPRDVIDDPDADGIQVVGWGEIGDVKGKRKVGGSRS